MVEILIVASVIVGAFIVALAVAQNSIFVARSALYSAQAGFLLEEGVQAVKILRDNDWDNISALSASTTYYPAFSSGTWTLSATPSTVGNFTRIVEMDSVNRDNSTGDISSSGTDDPGTKLFTVTVSWAGGPQNFSKTLSFYLSDIFTE